MVSDQLNNSIALSAKCISDGNKSITTLNEQQKKIEQMKQQGEETYNLQKKASNLINGIANYWNQIMQKTPDILPDQNISTITQISDQHNEQDIDQDKPLDNFVNPVSNLTYMVNKMKDSALEINKNIEIQNNEIDNLKILVKNNYHVCKNNLTQIKKM